MANVVSPVFADAPRMASPRLQRGRVSEIGAYYVVTTVTRDRQRIFLDDEVAGVVRREIERAWHVATLAWVLMPDHLHWLFELQSGLLSAAIQSFKCRSALAVGRGTGRDGGIWQPGFYDHRIRADHDLRSQALYLLENPVRAGIVQHAAQYPHAWNAWGLT